MRLFDLEVNPSATSPLTSQPTLPEKMAPSFPIRFSLTGNAQRERLMLPGHGTAVKTPLESAASTYGQRHTDKSKTCASPCRAFRHWDASGGSGHSELGLHSRLLNSRKAIILGIYFVEPVWEHLQIWRWDCPGLHATCRNVFKAVKRHKNTSWGQHLRCLFCHCLSKKPAQNNQPNQK